MSRRRRPPQRDHTESRRPRGDESSRPRGDEPPRPRGGSPGGRIARDIALLAALFGVTVGISELAGAANLGVSFGIGQVVFALALVLLLSRG